MSASDLLLSEEVTALANQNQDSFKQIADAIGRYMSKCGRRYVSLSSVFSYMKVAN